MDTAQSDAAPEFQAKGRAWHPFRPDIDRLLSESVHARTEPIYYGSNHCFLVTLECGDAGRSYAVYKPARGEYPLYDFPSGTLYRREVGTALVDSLLDWRLVPPTVVTRGKYGVGSLQLFIEAHEEGEVDVDELRRLALLDVILNNADRKPEHCLIGDEGKLWAIDHGLTFHVQTKLRTVLWHFAGMRISDQEISDLERMLAALSGSTDCHAKKLTELISGAERQALMGRVRELIRTGLYPNPRYKPIPYRW